MSEHKHTVDWSDYTTRIPTLLRDMENNANLKRFHVALEIGTELSAVVEHALGALRLAALNLKLQHSEDEHYRYVVMQKGSDDN